MTLLDHVRLSSIRLARIVITQTPLIAGLYTVLRHALYLPPEPITSVYAQLARVVARAPRRTPGEFRFPFGSVHYVDAASLQQQYYEIFLCHGYQFITTTERPRILDCGGNIGLSAIWFKQRYRESQLTVFEADPAIASILRRNLARLHIDDVRVIEAACWDQNGIVEFTGDGADSGRVTKGDPAMLVPAMRLSDLVGETVDLLKLDVEGAEFCIIADLCATGKITHIRCLICELHCDALSADEVPRMLTRLVEHGFRYTCTHARSAPDLPGEHRATPFPAVRDARFLLHLYAWRDDCTS